MAVIMVILKAALYLLLRALIGGLTLMITLHVLHTELSNTIPAFGFVTCAILVISTSVVLGTMRPYQVPSSIK